MCTAHFTPHERLGARGLEQKGLFCNLINLVQKGPSRLKQEKGPFASNPFNFVLNPVLNNVTENV